MYANNYWRNIWQKAKYMTKISKNKKDASWHVKEIRKASKFVKLTPKIFVDKEHTNVEGETSIWWDIEAEFESMNDADVVSRFLETRNHWTLEEADMSGFYFEHKGMTIRLYAKES